MEPVRQCHQERLLMLLEQLVGDNEGVFRCLHLLHHNLQSHAHNRLALSIWILLQEVHHQHWKGKSVGQGSLTLRTISDFHLAPVQGCWETARRL
eukprot:scaffold109476_cov33-Tisochrysis_lutea.AAC.1